jgi:7-keto-8-aminopelargonate synthetase-like enzyme
MRDTAEPLQQVDRTHVLWRGRTLIYFGGCDYLRLASHPAVLRAVEKGLKQHGLNVAASRKTTGNHPLYKRLERELARFFGVPAATLVSSGYVTNVAVAQALAGEFSHALLDRRAHPSLQDAASFLECPVVTFHHRDSDDLARVLRRLGRCRPLVFSDGMFSHDGSLAPLNDYLRLLPPEGQLLVDDAHGAGVLGAKGRGVVEHEGVSRERVIQTVTLSKAFGVYGGAVLGSRELAEKIRSRSRLFLGNTPLPLPLATAALQSLEIVSAGKSLRDKLAANAERVKEALHAAGVAVPITPGPIIPILPQTSRETDRLKRRLLSAGIHPPFIQYPGGPDGGYFRFAVSSEHTPTQLATLVESLVAHHHSCAHGQH